MLTFIDACVLARRALKAGNSAEMRRYVEAQLSDYWNDNATLVEYFQTTLSDNEYPTIESFLLSDLPMQLADLEWEQVLIGA